MTTPRCSWNHGSKQNNGERDGRADRRGDKLCVMLLSLSSFGCVCGVEVEWLLAGCGCVCVLMRTNEYACRAHLMMKSRVGGTWEGC